MTSESPVPSIQCPEIVQEKKINCASLNLPPQSSGALLDLFLLGLQCGVFAL